MGNRKYAPLPTYRMLQPCPHTALAVSFRKPSWPAVPGLSVPFWESNCTMERVGFQWVCGEYIDSCSTLVFKLSPL